MIKAVIFDIDRTLINSKPVEYNSFNKAYFKLRNEDVPSDVLKNLSNNTTEKTFALLKLSEEEAKLLNEYWDYYLSEEKIQFFNGITELLHKLKEEKYLLGILTSRGKDEFKSIKDLFENINELFDIVVTLDQVEKPKPSPSGLKLICDKLNLKANEIIYIGDHYNDFLCARDAGAEFGFAAWDNDLVMFDTPNILHKPDDVLKLLKKL